MARRRAWSPWRSRRFSRGNRIFTTCCLAAIALVVSLPYPAQGQGLGEQPVVGLDLTPSNPLGMPGTTGGLPRGSDTLNLSSRMFPDILPAIPGLEISYLHSFAQGHDWNRLLVEYVRPGRLGRSTTVYGEIHGTLYEPFESWSSLEQSIDLSVGGGYRRRFGDSAVVGVHGFLDATREFDSWKLSTSVGGFMVTMLPGHDAIDLSVNWYGGPGTSQLGQAWENGTFDGTITYYHELWEGGPDLRLSLAAYDVDESFLRAARQAGYGAGVLLASRDGKFRGGYMYSADRLQGEIHSFTLTLNVGFRVENLLALRSPVEKPTPIFSSPRNLDYWQNVASGTERTLAKELGDGRGEKCHYTGCKNCWGAIVWIWDNNYKIWPECGFQAGNNWVVYASCFCPKFRDWLFNVTEKCGGCAKCVYFIEDCYYPYSISRIKMNLKGRGDKGVWVATDGIDSACTPRTCSDW